MSVRGGTCSPWSRARPSCSAWPGFWWPCYEHQRQGGLGDHSPRMGRDHAVLRCGDKPMSIKKALDENTIVREARTRLEWNLGDMVCLTPYQAEVVREDIETLVLAIVGTAM